MTRLACVVMSMLLVASALALVTSQYRAREYFAELEVAQQEGRALDAEGSRLLSDLGHAAQPATVEAVARRLGMRAVNPDQIVMLPVNAPAPVPPPAGRAVPASAERP